jgi:hypothetical protein
LGEGRLVGLRVSPPRLTGYVAIVVAVGLCAWLIVSDRGGSALRTVTIGRSASATAPTATTGTPTALLTAAQLTARSDALGKPVYWAGDEPGVRFDLVSGSSGATTVRYVASTSGSETLRVSTIPFANAYAATEQLAARPGAFSQRLPNGSLVYNRPGHPSTYVVFPDVDAVIEVDAQSPAEARQVALSGRVGPIS